MTYLTNLTFTAANLQVFEYTMIDILNLHL